MSAQACGERPWRAPNELMKALTTNLPISPHISRAERVDESVDDEVGEEVVDLVAEANVRAGARYCAASSEHGVNTREKNRVNTAEYGRRQLNTWSSRALVGRQEHVFRF